MAERQKIGRENRLIKEKVVRWGEKKEKEEKMTEVVWNKRVQEKNKTL
jgi:hypothetical protein